MDALLYRTARTPAACERRTTMRYGASSRHMGEPRPAAGVEPGLLAAALAAFLCDRLGFGVPWLPSGLHAVSVIGGLVAAFSLAATATSTTITSTSSSSSWAANPTRTRPSRSARRIPCSTTSTRISRSWAISIVPSSRHLSLYEVIAVLSSFFITLHYRFLCNEAW